MTGNGEHFRNTKPTPTDEFGSLFYGMLGMQGIERKFSSNYVTVFNGTACFKSKQVNYIVAKFIVLKRSRDT